ncbi:MAG TPA: hypothetical protein VII06_11970, partial [Chloroflexota bacterium]
RPALVGDVAATRAALVGSANPTLAVTPFQTCGGIGSGTIPNDSFGYGRVDALAAVNYGPTPTPTLSRTPTPTRTPTPPPPPTPVSTPTPPVNPTSTPPPLACGTPPQVGVQATPNGDGRLRVTVTASPGRTLTEISFPGDPHTAGNGRIDTATATGQAPPLTLPLPPGTTAYTFYVRRVTPGQATTLSFTVRDNCGALWPSLVGGGPAAF